MDGQADLGLSCPHMPEDRFSHGPADFNQSDYDMSEIPLDEWQRRRPCRLQYLWFIWRLISQSGLYVLFEKGINFGYPVLAYSS